MSTDSGQKYSAVKFQQNLGYAVLTINRPEVLNALSFEVLSEISDILLDELDEEMVNTLVIEGAGDKAFVAGADIAAMEDMSTEEALEFSITGSTLMRQLELMPIVTIAKVDGYALGGGMELALACDIIVASEKAKFGLPEVNLGLIPGFGGTQRLTKKMGLAHAMDMVLGGNSSIIDGKQAYERGLVSRCVPHDKIDEEVDKIIKGLAKCGPKALAEAKRLVRESYDMPLDRGLSSESSTFANCFSFAEAKEGMQAFLQKRKPNFKQD